jgi:putative RecB family exonuclease
VEPTPTPVDLLPKRLSPSRAKDFVQCPKLFHYKTILGLRTPQTIATARGTLAHTVFERLFDFEREERTPERACGLLEPAWETMIEPIKDRAVVDPESLEARIRDAAGLWREEVVEGSDREARLLEDAYDYQELVPPGSPGERAFLDDVATYVENYFMVERPWNFDPVGREVHLEATFEDLTLHGFIDRLDRYTTESGEERWVISDYKTGKVPRARYLDDSFFAMKVYALLLSQNQDVIPYSLRLIYVGASKDQAVQVLNVDADLLESTKRKMENVWREIIQSAEMNVWEAKTGPLCTWCHFQPQCPAFAND